MESVLLQEAYPDDAGDLDHQLLVVGKHVCADQLNNFHQLAFLVKDRIDPGAVLDEILAQIFFKPGIQVGKILAVAGHPVDGGVMPSVSQRLIQSPEAPGKPFGILGYRLGKIAALGGYGADNRYGAFLAAKSLDAAGPLVEIRQAGGEISRKALLRRHFLQTAGDFPESLRPPGGGISHHRHVIAHIAVIFRQGDACINRSLAGRYRHVGGIGDQHGAVGHRTAGFRVYQLGELI